MSKIYTPVPHPRIEQRKKQRPVKVRDMMKRSNPFTRFNTWLAIRETNSVGTMWCAYAFGALALVSLPAATSDKRAEATYEDADAVLHTALQIQDHLAAQDGEIEKIVATLTGLKAT